MSLAREYLTDPTYTTCINYVDGVPVNTWQSLYKHEYGLYRAGETPQFNKQKKHGNLIPHQHYLKHRVSLLAMPLPYTYHYVGSTHNNGINDWNIYGLSYGTFTIDKNLIGGVQDGLEAPANIPAMQQEAFADIAPKLDAFTTIAESGKTAQMFVDLKKRTERLIKMKRRGYALKGLITSGEIIDVTASARMEWRYGWRLLYFDIVNAVKEFNDPQHSIIIEGKSSAYSKTLDDLSKLERAYPNLLTINYEVEERGDYYCYVSAAVQIKFRSMVILKSPAVTAWELVKLSFIADWFVSVGDALRAWEVIRKASSITNSLNSVYECVHTGRILSVDVDPNSTLEYYTLTGGFIGETKNRIRTPLGAVSYFPQLRIRLDTARVLDAATILKSKFKTK